MLARIIGGPGTLCDLAPFKTQDGTRQCDSRLVAEPNEIIVSKLVYDIKNKICFFCPRPLSDLDSALRGVFCPLMAFWQCHARKLFASA
jgi:hypothetical protein